MKFIFASLALLLMLNPLTAAAEEAPGLGMSIGTGLRSDKGLLGIGIDVPVGRAFAQFDVGADPAGLLLSAMYKVPIYQETSGEHWLSKCLFLFECDSSVLVGVGLKHFMKSTVIVRPGAADETEYEHASRWAAGGTVTLRSHFRTAIFWDVDVTYRQVFNDGEITLTRGTEQPSDKSDLKTWDSGIGVGTSLGYRF